MRRVLEAIRLLHGCDDLDVLAERVLEATKLVVSCDTGVYTEINHARRRAVHRSGDPVYDEEMAAVAPAFERFFHQHPVAEFARRDPVPVTRISDFLSQRQLRQLGVHRDCFRLIGINRQIGVCLSSSPNLVVGVGLNRVRGAFGERDRERLALLRPHLVEAYRSVSSRTDLREHLARQDLALDALRVGLLTVDAEGRILAENVAARRALTEVFPGRTGRDDRLPSEVCGWLRAAVGRLDWIDAPGAVNAAADFVGPGGNLRVRLLVEEQRDRFTLLLRYDGAVDSIAKVHRDGLTRREAEVLHRLTLGETNKEIAAALGMRPGTARIHVERILRKLGVTSRTAAARTAIAWRGE